jgi:CheY-like chemotaxis protein
VKSYRILHVDDDPLMQDVVELALSLDSEFAVLSCASAAEALAAVADWVP